MKIKTNWISAALCGLMASTSIAGTVKIGVAGPHTGANAAFGEQLWKGAEQAAKDINAAGGINGNTIELIKADDACEPKQAVSIANRLVDLDGAVAVVGHFCSSSTMPASDIYDEASILMMTPGSTNPQITERGLTATFRMCGRDDQQGTVAAEFIVNQLKAKQVAVIHDKDTYGQGLADAMKAHMASLGVEPAIYEGLTRGEKDFNALVTKLKSLKVDAIYFGGLHAEAGPLVRQIREQGLDAAFISGDGIVSEEFVTNAGGPQFAQGVYMTFGRDPRKVPQGKAVIETFRKSNYEPEGYTLYSYATMQAVAQALANVKDYDGELASEWLKNNTVSTVMGPKSWDSKGDLVESDYVMYVWDATGKYGEVK